jgi:ADP-heptose:LPS heptosyltransferase
MLLTDPLGPPAHPHRAEHWRKLAQALGWELAPAVPAPRPGRHAVIHTGAGQSTRLWPQERFDDIAVRLRAAGWQVTLLDDSWRDLDRLLDTLASADRFIGNDSGPGHLAALLGVPTFTIFGPTPVEVFSPQHPLAVWVEGRPCPYKPCRDYCRFTVPHCLHEIPVAEVWSRLQGWLNRP